MAELTNPLTGAQRAHWARLIRDSERRRKEALQVLAGMQMQCLKRRYLKRDLKRLGALQP